MREVIDHREQRDPRRPGDRRFPLEPVQRVRHLAGADAPALDAVEPAAVHHPQPAFDGRRGHLD